MPILCAMRLAEVPPRQLVRLAEEVQHGVVTAFLLLLVPLLACLCTLCHSSSRAGRAAAGHGVPAAPRPAGPRGRPAPFPAKAPKRAATFDGSCAAWLPRIA